MPPISAGEGKNVLPVKWRDEGAVQFVDQDAACLIRFLLLQAQLLGDLTILGLKILDQ
jgi:hypothetical protein